MSKTHKRQNNKRQTHRRMKLRKTIKHNRHGGKNSPNTKNRYENIGRHLERPFNNVNDAVFYLIKYSTNSSTNRELKTYLTNHIRDNWDTLKNKTKNELLGVMGRQQVIWSFREHTGGVYKEDKFENDDDAYRFLTRQFKPDDITSIYHDRIPPYEIQQEEQLKDIINKLIYKKFERNKHLTKHQWEDFIRNKVYNQDEIMDFLLAEDFFEEEMPYKWQRDSYYQENILQPWIDYDPNDEIEREVKESEVDAAKKMKKRIKKCRKTNFMVGLAKMKKFN